MDVYISLNTVHITGRDLYEELLQLKLQGWNISVVGFLTGLVSKSSPVLGLNFLRGVDKARTFFLMFRLSPVILCQKWAVAGNGLKQANSCWMLLVLVPINTKKNRNTDGPCQLRFFGHALFQIITDLGKNTNSAPEGRRDFLNTPKCAQGTHLYKCYEATYTLKRLVSEKIAKNRF